MEHEHHEGEHFEGHGCQHGGKHHFGHMFHHMHMRRHLPFMITGIFLLLLKIVKMMKAKHDMKKRAMYTVRGGIMGAMAMAILGTWKWICWREKRENR